MAGVSKNPSTSDFSVVECSMDEMSQISEDLHKLMLSDEMRALPTKGCHILHLVNLPKSNILRLASKEQKGFLSRQADRVKKKIYRCVGRVFLVYVPIIQATTSGLITLKLQNSDTGEISDVVTDVEANRAFVIMDRWGRSLVESADLNLLYSISCPDVRPGARVGEMMAFWDERMSRQQTYLEKGNPILFPIAETKPSKYLNDKKVLMSMVRSRILAGTEGCDIAPENIEVKRLGGNRKVLTIQPKAPIVEEIKDDVEPLGSNGENHMEEKTVTVKVGSSGSA
uniref:Movement protein n=1 Tax=Prunus necrotic ringspot virus TaxID=37733 RepID=A0A0U3K7V3_9BROM|nr:movement protein [Prunus necrotic ringspot virus]